MFPQTPKRTIRIRWLLKSVEINNETIEQKQQRQSKYKDLLIISAPVKDDMDESSSVLCLITLPEEEQPIDPSMQQKEEVTIRLDTTGKIISLDTTSLRNTFASHIMKESGRSISELCHFQDRQRLQMHLKEVIQNPSEAPSTTYRLKVGAPDLYVHVRVHSKMFPSSMQNESDFVMAVHTLLTDNEISALDIPSGANTMHCMSSGMQNMLLPNTSNAMSSHNQQKHLSNSSLGGPLMTSVINGSLAGGSRNGQNSLLSDSSSNGSLMHQHPSSVDNFFPETFDFIDEFPSSTYEIDGTLYMDTRTDSRASVTPVSTPRPSSVSAAYSPAAAPLCPSPLTPYPGGTGSAGQPSPSNNNNNNQMVNNNLTSNNSSSSSTSGGFVNNNFSFPNFEDSKEKIQEQIQLQQQQKQQEVNSGKLRNLLTKTSSGSSMDAAEQERSTNQILKVRIYFTVSF